jgi:hypothetical protein
MARKSLLCARDERVAVVVGVAVKDREDPLATKEDKTPAVIFGLGCRAQKTLVLALRVAAFEGLAYPVNVSHAPWRPKSFHFVLVLTIEVD